MTGKRFSGGVLALAAAVAFSFGAIASVATADHYHVNCNNHGLVHGSSTADSNYHARVEGTPCYARHNSACIVRQWTNYITATYASAGVTCNAHAVGYGPECAGAADVELRGFFGEHRHYAHNRC